MHVTEAPSRLAADVSLRSALEELSNLSSPSSATRPAELPAPVVPRTDPLRLPGTEPDVPRDSMRILPLSAAAQGSSTPGFSKEPQPEEERQQPAVLTAIDIFTPVIVSTLLNPEITDSPSQTTRGTHRPSNRASENLESITTTMDRPADLASALQELVDQHSGMDPAKEVLSHRSRRMGWLVGSAVAVLAAFGMGVLVGRSFVAVPREKDSAAVKGAAQAGDGAGFAAVDKIPGQSVAGRVMYSDAAGAKKPDSGAFVLLVPAENTSGLKLNAEPLRDRQASDAKLAVEASIRILKGSVTRCSEDGTFTVERRHPGPVKLIVISRHVSRAEGEPVEPTAAKTLADWFESPSQLTGRLQVQEKVLSVAENGNNSPLEVAFRKQ